MKQDNTVQSERKFSSLDDIRLYKEELLEQIRQDRDVISTKWNDLFHREEPTPQSKAQKIMKMLNMGTGVLDGAMLGWKLYRKYQEGAFLFGKRRRK